VLIGDHSGAFSNVYKAIDLTTQKKVASTWYSAQSID
jgi:hypothetical protein